MQPLSRRTFMGTCGALIPGVTLPCVLRAQQPKPAKPSAAKPDQPKKETYETHAKGIRIFPGQWRPHYPWEHIAWISPAWPSQDYVWLDFPEAIFAGHRLLYLSHVNPVFQVEFPDLPRVAWKQTDGGVMFERTLPNGVSFSASLTKKDATTVNLEIGITNGSNEPLKNITLQTCMYLRGIKEFADYTRDNKFVHHPERGWITLTEAITLPEGPGPYRIGWRSWGTPLADLPITVAVSNQAQRLVAMTWQTDTLSLVSNPKHPCMHADPKFKDLSPGEAASVHGRIAFFEGPLKDFDHQAFLRA